MEVVVNFALSSLSPGVGQPLPEWLRPDTAGGGMPPPPGHPKVPGEYGHRYATRYQLRHRLAGDQHSDLIRTFEPRPVDHAALQRPTELEEGIPAGWLIAAGDVQVQQPTFNEGEKHLFAVRLGDDFRWSAWSAFSKPLHIRLPSVEAPPGGLSVTVESTDGRVLVEWDTLSSELKVPVECQVWLRASGPDGKDAKDGQQLVLMHLDGEGASHGDRGDDGTSAGVRKTRIAANVGRLEPARQYRFVLLARPACYILGVPAFAEVASTAPITWVGDTLVQPGTERVLPESWDIPVPLALSVPEGLEASSGRWRGRAVLLSWPKGVVVSEDPPLELQACAAGEDPVSGWAVVSWSLLRLQERPCVVAAPLPFCTGRFRWRSRDRRMAGPRSEVCLAGAEPPSGVCAEVFCTTSAVRVAVRATLCHESHRSTPFCQVRWQPVGPADDTQSGELAPLDDWVVQPQAEVQTVTDVETGACSLHVRLTLGEEDGLELGRRYWFSVRVGDRRRRSQWSVASAAVVLDVPPEVVPKFGDGNELQVEALTPNSTRFWWRELHAAEAVNARTLVPLGKRPALEYRMDVSRCLDSGGIERHASVLLEDDPNGSAPFSCTVNGLSPSSRYFAALVVRFARLGRREWRKTGLTSQFETPAEPT